MKIEIKDLANFAEKNPDYIFKNWKTFSDGFRAKDYYYNSAHGILTKDEAEQQYANIKKLYGFLISPSERAPGKITGGKVYPFFFCDDGYSKISLDCKEGFNAIHTTYSGHRLFKNVKYVEEEAEHTHKYLPELNLNALQLFTTKEEARAALKVAAAEALDSHKEERRKYLRSQIEICEAELANLKKELKALQ